MLTTNEVSDLSSLEDFSIIQEYSAPCMFDKFDSFTTQCETSEKYLLKTCNTILKPALYFEKQISEIAKPATDDKEDLKNEVKKESSIAEGHELKFEFKLNSTLILNQLQMVDSGEVPEIVELMSAANSLKIQLQFDQERFE